MVKINILCDNSAGIIDGCLAERGLSLLIEVGSKKLLFDTGYSDVYIHNAQLLGVDLNLVDFVVLSHYHVDHSRGLQYHEFHDKKKLVIHPEILSKIPQKESEKIVKDFEVISSKKTIEFSSNIFFLGEIPRSTDFESGKYKSDTMLDDSAIAIKTEKGTIIITGCSHSGVCNICEYAKKITGQKIYALVGGFHLFEDSQETENSHITLDKTIRYFENEKIQHLIPMHCVDFKTFNKLFVNFGCIKHQIGDSINL